MDADDLDDNDQQPDFRLLLTNSKGPSAKQALPSRDAKSTQDPAVALNEQYEAYFQILAEERRAAERTFSRAVYEPGVGLFRISVNRGTHLVSMGHTLRGQIYLYPEEALYLVDRGSLIIEHHGVDMTVQQVWSVYLSQVHSLFRTQQDATQGARNDEDDSSEAMNRYLTYAYLKRLGFVVIRPGTYGQESNARKQQAPEQTIIRFSAGALFWSALWTSVFEAWKRNTSAIVAGIGSWLAPLTELWSRGHSRPLVANNDSLDYDQILKTLQIIPDMRLAQPKIPADQGVHCNNKKTRTATRREVDFEVYKPAGAFKKRQPGISDYKVVVVSSTAALPTLGELADLMDGQTDPASGLSLSMQTTREKGKKPKAPAWPQILFAVVNGGQVSFVNMFNVKAVP
ncbi:tRNA-splicing endonuclease subunit sen54 [Mortierella polycephala]|uniref:tRNA-splicing endonuclease subunit sen54 n=1 Tax=Mortierella polycephala TaxID=41804 RepID=A0A9P6Q005_9FUNG|nr:tRNA-splicing endonuclease subunit sen54 [Mortierella polycephala]